MKRLGRMSLMVILSAFIFSSISEARFYDSCSGRWTTRDPLEEEGDVNLYRAMGNNPINAIDPLGLDIALHVGLPQGKNIFGHVAAAVTNNGVYSSGTKEPFGSSFTDYLKDQSAYRDSIVYVIPTSPEQDNAFVKAFLNAAKDKHSATRNNCVDITGEGLRAAGIIKSSAMLKFPGLMHAYMLMRSLEGKVSAIVDIQRGNHQWKEIDTLLNQFNPR